MKDQTYTIKTIASPQSGSLSYFEGMRDIPFEIMRIYYITGANAGVERGGHAHRKLKQFLFCPYGSILLKLDDGINKSEVLLDSPTKGLLLTATIWRQMVWKTDNSVLCVATSDYYDEADYIRDYSNFLEFVGVCND